MMADSPFGLQPGYYWVRAGSDWFIAEWDGEAMWVCGSDAPMDSLSGLEIVDTPLPPPQPLPAR